MKAEQTMCTDIKLPICMRTEQNIIQSRRIQWNKNRKTNKEFHSCSFEKLYSATLKNIHKNSKMYIRGIPETFPEIRVTPATAVVGCFVLSFIAILCSDTPVPFV